MTVSDLMLALQNMIDFDKSYEDLKINGLDLEYFNDDAGMVRVVLSTDEQNA